MVVLVTYRAKPKLAQWSYGLQLAGKNFVCNGRPLIRVSSYMCTVRLAWTCQFAFKRLGRATMTAIYAQKTARKGTLSRALKLALLWWKEVLEQHLGQLRPWAAVRTETVDLVCDVRSTPPRVVAVLRIDRDVFYSDAATPACVMSSFHYREDNQVASLEILSIAFGMAASVCVCVCVYALRVHSCCCPGLSTFAHKLKGRNVCVHSDSTGAQHATSKGRAKAFDHTCLVHGIWYGYPYISSVARLS